MSDYRGIGEQSLDVAVAEPGNPVEVEAVEGTPERIAFAQDRQPGEPGLKALETELLEKAPVVGDRPAPLGVVIRTVFGCRVGPGATDDAVLASGEPWIRDEARLRPGDARKSGLEADDKILELIKWRINCYRERLERR